MQDEPQKMNLKMVLFIQTLVLVYSLVGLLSKVASGVLKNNGFFFLPFIALFGGMVLCMAIYAFFWQKVLQRVNLVAAYVHKSMSLLWSLLWSALFFSEAIRWNNIVGVLIIIAGIVMVTKDD